MIVVKSADVKPIVNEKGDPMIAKGLVYRQPLIDEKESGGFGAALVKFNAGASLKFHSHPVEQILYVLEGKGVIATESKEYTVTPGMAVFIPPGEIHLHRATEDSSFMHLAVYKGQAKIID
jgi:quercetin dioxygenase-like cupin family protein